MTWISVNDRLPKTDEEILMFTKRKDILVGTFHESLQIEGHFTQYKFLAVK